MKNIDKKNESKRDNFKHTLLIGGAAVATASSLVALGLGREEIKSMDMSKYNIDNEKYMEYAKTDDDNTMYRLAKLEDNIRIYDSLSSGNLTPAQTETLNKVKSEIKFEMTSKMISKLYLNM